MTLERCSACARSALTRSVEQERSWPTTLTAIIVASVASPMFTRRLVLNRIFSEKVGGLDL